MNLEALEQELFNVQNKSTTVHQDERHCDLLFIFPEALYDFDTATKLFLDITSSSSLCERYMKTLYPWHSLEPYKCILGMVRFHSYYDCNTFYSRFKNVYNIDVIIRPWFRLCLYYVYVDLKSFHEKSMTNNIVLTGDNNHYLFKCSLKPGNFSFLVFTTEKIQFDVYKLLKEARIKVWI